MDLPEINPADCQKCSEDAYPCSTHAQDWRYWKDRAHEAEEQAATNALERDRLSKALQTERRRNIAMEEAGGAESILSDLGNLLDARVGWFEGEGSVDHVRRALDERDTLRAALEEARLVLAAEQGRLDGAPSPGWTFVHSSWVRGDLVVAPSSTGRGWQWTDRGAVHSRSFADTARAAMIAADKATP